MSVLLSGVGLQAYEIPEWKEKAMGKAVSYGQKDARSIKEQRDSLPIAKLQDQLVQAVADNQVRHPERNAHRGEHVLMCCRSAGAGGGRQ